jgi:restriction system protein
MPIPDFQSMMLPILTLLGDGKERRSKDINEYLSKKYELTEDELKEMLPSQRARRFPNRVAWVFTYFKHAGLIDSPARGVYRITDTGRGVLAKNPERIDLRFLKQYDSIKEFTSSKKDKIVEEAQPQVETTRTPTEIMQEEYLIMKRSLAQDILSTVKSCSPTFFEALVVDLLLAMGYGGSRIDAGEITSKTNDGGIDGVIKEDKLGLDSVYIQAKRWQNSVGRPDVQAFVGALEGQRARKGVMITTSTFSDGAITYVKNIDKRVVLIDGEMLAELMIEHNVGVAASETYIIKKIDSDYFSEEF